MNDFYVHGTYPTTGAPGASVSMRAELDLITGGFDKFPILSTGANRALIVNGAGTAVTLTTGALALAGNLTTSGAYALTFTLTAATTLTLPTTGTLVTLAGAETLTTKTINLTSNTLTGTIAQFNTACSDADFATLAGSDTLTNKTLNLTSNTLTGTIAQFNTACSDADFLVLAGGNLTGGVNHAKTTVASAATPDIFATTVGNYIDYTGTVTATGFVAAPQAGAWRHLHCAGAAPFTAGANLLIPGTASASTYTCAANDVVHVYAKTTTLFELRIEKANGTPVAVDGLTAVTAVASDYVVIADTSDSSKPKKALVSDFAFTAATQAEQEAASSITVGTTPGRQHFHPSAWKSWVRFNGTGVVGIATSYNMTSITDDGVGAYTVTIANDMLSTNYPVFATCKASDTNANESNQASCGVIVAGSFFIETANANGARVDCAVISAGTLGAM